MLWLAIGTALAQSTPTWEASAHLAVWSVPFEYAQSIGLWEAPPLRNAGLQLSWRPRSVRSSPEVFARGSLWRDYDIHSAARLLPKNEGNLMFGAGWRHVQPVHGRWSVDLGASVAVGLSTKNAGFTKPVQPIVSPCADAGVWGHNVRVGLRGCGSTGNKADHRHDEVWSTPEPTGLRLVVGAKLHRWRDHSQR